MDEKAFETAYKRLNTAQKKAVDCIEGPVMVIAGPGTGKTQVLTLRIANILKTTDVAPEQILALTFTESGAHAMRSRLHSLIGTLAYRVAILTFHGLAEECIRAYPEAYGNIIGGTIASEIDQVEIIESILHDAELNYLRPPGNPLYYVKDIRFSISEMKRENILPSVFASYIKQEEEALHGIEQYHTKGAHKGKVRGEYATRERSLEKNRELLGVYETYEQQLRSKKLYDFEDMILYTIKALQDDDEMRLSLQETYQYVLADEHQDINGSQNAILRELTSYHKNPNVFVVGDEKQAIYRFQGASLENFLYFNDAFGSGATISLTENYRSLQGILNATQGLVETDDEELKKLRTPFNSVRQGLGCVEERSFSHESYEVAWIAEDLKAKLSKGVNANECAVIVRRNSDVVRISSELKAYGIPVSQSYESDVLEHPAAIQLRALLRAVVQPEREDALFALLHGSYWGIPAPDLVRICSARSRATPLCSLIGNRELLSGLGVSDPDSVVRVSEVLKKAREQEVTHPPHRILEFLLKESGLLHTFLKNDSMEAVRVIRRIYDEVEMMISKKEVKTLEDVVLRFDTLLEHTIALRAQSVQSSGNSVTVMTAHKSKGLEFEHVYIPFLTDRRWGGGRSKSTFDIPTSKRQLDAHVAKEAAIDDEIRLLYVAMTRAKDSLSLSSSTKTIDGKSEQPSRLLDRLVEGTVDHLDVEAFEHDHDPYERFLKGTVTESNDFVPLVTEVLEKRGFSATSFNNFSKDPWLYFYRNVLRVPELKSLSLLYGTAMHEVMDRVSKRRRDILKENEGEYDRGQLVEILRTCGETVLQAALNRLPLSTVEYNDLKKKGHTAVETYIPHFVETAATHTKEEFSVTALLKTGIPSFPAVTLTGKLDRLDFNENGTLQAVVDYKTGKPKSKNQIEGKTKKNDSSYKRQLVFYALLLSLSDRDDLRSRKGVISFLEPDKNGNVSEFSFTITDEEIEAQKLEIIEAVKSITSGAMFEAPNTKETNEYYELTDAFLSL